MHLQTSQGGQMQAHLLLPQQHLELRRKIKSCESMNDLLDVYDNDLFQGSLRTLRMAVGQDNVYKWAREWAIRMRQEQVEDVALNESRKSVLLLLKKLVECWRLEDNHTVTDHSLVHDFGRKRIVNILQIALVMDKMQCLYKMQYAGDSRYGMHWVARQHMLDEPWKQLLTKHGGEPTMSNNYVALLEHVGLGLQNIPFIVHCLTPEKRPAIEHL